LPAQEGQGTSMFRATASACSPAHLDACPSLTVRRGKTLLSALHQCSARGECFPMNLGACSSVTMCLISAIGRITSRHSSNVAALHRGRSHPRTSPRERVLLPRLRPWMTPPAEMLPKVFPSRLSTRGIVRESNHLIPDASTSDLRVEAPVLPPSHINDTPRKFVLQCVWPIT
jgi:hypothetical protein